jgi:hypothetical protein
MYTAYILFSFIFFHRFHFHVSIHFFYQLDSELHFAYSSKFNEFIADKERFHFPRHLIENKKYITSTVKELGINFWNEGQKNCGTKALSAVKKREDPHLVLLMFRLCP